MWWFIERPWGLLISQFIAISKVMSCLWLVTNSVAMILPNRATIMSPNFMILVQYWDFFHAGVQLTQSTTYKVRYIHQFHDMETGSPRKKQWRIKTNHLKATRENVALQCLLPFAELIRLKEQGKLQCVSACNSPESLYPKQVTTQKSGYAEGEYILLCNSPSFLDWLWSFLDIPLSS